MEVESFSSPNFMEVVERIVVAIVFAMSIFLILEFLFWLLNGHIWIVTLLIFVVVIVWWFGIMLQKDGEPKSKLFYWWENRPWKKGKINDISK